MLIISEYKKQSLIHPSYNNQIMNAAKDDENTRLQ